MDLDYAPNIAEPLDERFGQGAPSGRSPVRRFRFQPWLTLYGPAAIDEVVQPCRHYLDGLNEATYHFQVEVLSITNVTLVVESAQSQEGPWSQCTGFGSTTDTMVVLSSEGGSMNFSRYVRWRLDGDGVNDWEISFQMLLTSGAAVSETKLSPRKA